VQFSILEVILIHNFFLVAAMNAPDKYIYCYCEKMESKELIYCITTYWPQCDLSSSPSSYDSSVISHIVFFCLFLYVGVQWAHNSALARTFQWLPSNVAYIGYVLKDWLSSRPPLNWVITIIEQLFNSLTTSNSNVTCVAITHPWWRWFSPGCWGKTISTNLYRAINCQFNEVGFC
jgi:hypothetical protein